MLTDDLAPPGAKPSAAWWWASLVAKLGVIFFIKTYVKIFSFPWYYSTWLMRSFEISQHVNAASSIKWVNHILMTTLNSLSSWFDDSIQSNGPNLFNWSTTDLELWHRQINDYNIYWKSWFYISYNIVYYIYILHTSTSQIWKINEFELEIGTPHWLQLALLTHWGRDKWTPFRRRHFQMHFLEWKCLNSD